jgi:CPA1 family monovalent cation:H+ antiporter
MPLILGWTGMRGVVSLAAALAIPVTLANGSPFPHRNLILFITFVVILVTLLAQGLTLPYIFNNSRAFGGFADDSSEESKRHDMKLGLKEHVHLFLQHKLENEEHHRVEVEIILKHWEARSKISDEDWMNEKTKAIFVAMLERQREYLHTLNQDPTISEELIQQQLYQIDLEEERLKII